MNIGDTYANTCDGQSSTWTIKAIEGGMVTVYSPQSDRSYTIDKRIFEDTMKALGFELVNTSNYRLFHPKYQAFYAESFEYFNEAVSRGLRLGYDFQVELGSMICATWDQHERKLLVTEEYRSWYQDQQSMLAKVEGSYPLP